MSGRYLLFEGDIYYPSGGAHDFAGVFPTIETAKAAAKAVDESGSGSWAHIAEEITMRVVSESNHPYYEKGPRVWRDTPEGQPL